MRKQTPIQGAGEGLPSNVQALFAQWLEADEKANDRLQTDSDAQDWLSQLMELEGQIMQAPVRTAADLAMKVLAVTGNGDFADIDGPNAPALWSELRRMAGVLQ